MEWPQITMIVIMAWSLVINSVLHGRPQGEFNVVIALIALVLNTWILHEGGFW